MKYSAPLKITAITFDLGNVLIRVDHLRFCRRLAALAALSPQEVYAQVFESGLEPGYDTGRITSREFYQRVTDHFGVALTNLVVYL
jgi:FMN phosphatase YigB (HAD superfamily)